MSELSKAVFLSYASQDAEAARRICDALRAAGIEVWFDQSELRGGDAWDRQIRRQIHECALLVPIVSRSTQARPEGYFRLEWKLAVERTHLMSDRMAFLVPVVVDDTRDVEADVPDAFRGVQWTRLPGGETPPAFVSRISQLLSPSEPHAPSQAKPSTASAPSPRLQTGAAAVSQRLKLSAVLIAGVVIIGGGYLALDKFVLSKRTAGPAPVSATASLPAEPAHKPVNEQSVAVLPFVNESSDKEQEYFADGLTETMIGLLSKVQDLRVPARSASFYFKGKNEELAAIAGKLHVVHLLEGTVRRAGNRLRISADLIRADTGYHVWSESYDRNAGDIFKVQDEISAAVVAALKLKLIAAGTNAKVRGTSNVEAYSQYLLGVHYGNTEVLGPDMYRRQLAAYRKALTMDPAYADAAAKLVLVEAFLADITGDAAGLKHAIAAAERLPLEHPDHGPSYRIRAAIRDSWQWDWAGTQADFEKALALDPADADAHFDKAVLLQNLGRYPQAIAAVQKALALDGLNLSYLQLLAGIQMSMRDYAAADKTLSRLEEIEPHSELLAQSLSILRLLQGRFADSLAQCPKIQDERTRLGCVAEAQHSLGHRAEADQAYADLLKTGTGGNLTYLAGVSAWFGNADQAFAWYDKAVAARESQVVQILADRTQDVLQKDPRWAALLKKINLPE